MRAFFRAPASTTGMRILAPSAVLFMLLVGPGALPADANNPIQPGDQINGICTLAFIFDGQGPVSGKVYGLTAAHCVNRVGQSMSTQGHSGFGVVAYKGNDDRSATDFALIEIHPNVHDHVVASVRGHAQYPTGSTVSTETQAGDLLQFSGYGSSFSFTGPTREERQGTLTRDTASVFYLVGPMDFGDSGGPIVHIETGKALGIESRVGAPFGSDEGPTIEGILNKAAAAGFPLQIRTV